MTALECGATQRVPRRRLPYQAPKTLANFPSPPNRESPLVVWIPRWSKPLSP